MQQRCFQRRDSLHHNADMCYCFTTAGSPGRDAMQRSRTVRTKMEECDSSRFYCWVMWMPMQCMMGILLSPLKVIKFEKSLLASCKGRHFVVRKQSIGGRCSSGHVEWCHVWSGLWWCKMSTLWQVRSVDARETKQNLKLKPKCNYWLLCF